MNVVKLKKSENVDFARTKVISRDQIPGITHVIEGGVRHDLGIVKNFRAITDIDNFIPQNARLAPSWVHLKKGERLEVHTHPIDSFYIITEGEAVLLGELEGQHAKAGDIILIPKFCEHGFIGSGANGYWGLSIQFEARGLYEDTTQPLVAFNEPNEHASLKKLSKVNEYYLERFRKNQIFNTIYKVRLDQGAKDVFLDYMQCLSDHFQKMMLLRSALCENQTLSTNFWQHLVEEFGHNEKLKKSRSNFQARFDPIFDALCMWFTHKMATLDDIQKFFLVNYIIEAAAAEFYKHAYPLFADTTISHFEEHAELDQKHGDYDWNVFFGLNSKEMDSLQDLQKQAWDVIEAQYQRLSDLTTSRGKE